MTIAETKNFYMNDTKSYQIKKNKEFLNWLENSIIDGYHCFIDIGELQELIDNIVNWYEIKYPERELEYFEGTRYMNFKYIKSISDVMNVRQLLYRLPKNQLSLIECGYRAKGWGQHLVSKNNKEELKIRIFMHIYRKNDACIAVPLDAPSFLLSADHVTGKVSKCYDIDEYLDSEDDIVLDELLSILEDKYTDELDFSELKACVYDHNCDMELRHRILQFVALKLLYSKNTIPERGYERAKRFINEFNKKLGLTLSMNEIDEIMNRDYRNNKDETIQETVGFKKKVRKIFNSN